MRQSLDPVNRHSPRGVQTVSYWPGFKFTFQGFLQAPQASWLSTDFGVSSPSSVGAILGSGLKDQINVRSAFAGLASSDTYPIGQSKTIRAQSILTCKRSQSDQDLGAECSSLDPSQLQKISILSQPFIQ